MRDRGRNVGTAVVVAAAIAATGATAATNPLATIEKTLMKRYPGVAGPLLGSSPYRERAMRVVYTIGAVSVWFQTRADRAPACAAARANTASLRDAIIGQIMPSADDVRFWASRGISPVRGVNAFRAGILRACKLRGG